MVGCCKISSVPAVDGSVCSVGYRDVNAEGGSGKEGYDGGDGDLEGKHFSRYSQMLLNCTGGLEERGTTF